MENEFILFNEEWEAREEIFFSMLQEEEG